MHAAEMARAESRVISDFAGAMPTAGLASPPRIELKQDDVRNGLGKLVLTVIELLRELLERQAIRRIEGGSLTDAEIERLGTTFMQLADEMEWLKQEFGVANEDLNIDLGPLGTLF